MRWLGFLVLVFAFHLFVDTHANVVGNFSGSFIRVDGSRVTLIVSWHINGATDRIRLNVWSPYFAPGYVGIGLSNSRDIRGADVFIGGMYDNRTNYHDDYHVTQTGNLVKDTYQDWQLEAVYELYQEVQIIFSRALNTCDDQDFEITEDTSYIFVALGETDDIVFDSSLWQPHQVQYYKPGYHANFKSQEYNMLNLTIYNEMPDYHTSKWCTIHELPELNAKHHIVAFTSMLMGDAAEKHTYQITIYQCIAPDTDDPETLFGPWINPLFKGDHCYQASNASFPFKQYCADNVVFAWRNGGGTTVLPDNVGIPLGWNGNVKEYYAMEIQYDNPEQVYGKYVETGGRFYYTDKLREFNAGIFKVEQKTGIQITVPPNSTDFVVAGHCSPECTQGLHPKGINVFNSLMHTHESGHAVKLRHFRGDKELKWVDSDRYYDSNYQVNRYLTEEVTVLPGDQLTVECTYASNDKAVIGGFSRNEEECQAWLLYYPKQEFKGCGSAQQLDKHLELFGIEETTEGAPSFPGGLPAYEVCLPENLIGDYITVVSSKINWTDSFRKDFQQEKRFGEQQSYCGLGDESRSNVGEVKYPENLEEYVPINKCEGFTTTTTSRPTTTDFTTTDFITSEESFTNTTTDFSTGSTTDATSDKTTVWSEYGAAAELKCRYGVLIGVITISNYFVVGQLQIIQ